jgi:RNA polymerase sigma-70 factor (sigma-E family)
VALAEEIVQDSFVAVHSRWRRLRDPDRALAYLRQTVVNRGRSALRHRGVVERHAAKERPVTTLPGADQVVMSDDRRDRVMQALRDLPARQREVLALRYYSELSEAEIADALGISRGAVKSHASRGAAALRVSLADYLEDRS